MWNIGNVGVPSGDAPLSIFWGSVGETSSWPTALVKMHPQQSAMPTTGEWQWLDVSLCYPQCPWCLWCARHSRKYPVKWLHCILSMQWYRQSEWMLKSDVQILIFLSIPAYFFHQLNFIFSFLHKKDIPPTFWFLRHLREDVNMHKLVFTHSQHLHYLKDSSKWLEALRTILRTKSNCLRPKTLIGIASIHPLKPKPVSSLLPCNTRPGMTNWLAGGRESPNKAPSCWREGWEQICGKWRKCVWGLHQLWLSGTIKVFSVSSTPYYALLIFLFALPVTLA